MGGKSYEAYVKKGTPWWKVIANILFSNLGLLLLVIGYAVGGARVFMALEQEREDLAEGAKITETQNVNDAITFLKQQFWQYGTNEHKYNYTREEFKEQVRADLKAMERYVLEAHQTYGYDGTLEYEREFSFESTLLFTVTIMTTVGYGHIAPGTSLGKLFCIGYALLGIPLMVLFMASIGDWMATTFRWIYSRVLCRWCRARRRDSELPPEMDRRTLGIGRDDIGKERYMPTDLVMVPIMVNLILIFLFIFLGAVMFNLMEGWDPATSAYFCFVTLTTIGFGDYTPVNSFKGLNNPKALAMMTFTLTYCIFGMTLISMCLSLMQEQIIDKVSWMVESLGGGNDDEEVVKLSKEGKVVETPADKTGNELNFKSDKTKKKKKKGEEEELVDEQGAGDPEIGDIPEIGIDNVAYEELE